MKRVFYWSRTSTTLIGVFLLVIFVIGYVWWPLLADYIRQYNPEIPLWRQIDWLLIGNFLVMSLLITLNADLKHDIPFAFIALAGGFIIEAWGTLSGLWTYYTYETPPLWIVPAWPIAALSVNRLYLIFKHWTRNIPEKWFNGAYWPIFGSFSILLLNFVWPTLSHPLTVFALIICALVMFTTKQKRDALLILGVGSALGYFLERWGTTRLCWTYYTGGFPPFFTVIAHGMASIAVWWVFRIYVSILSRSRLEWMRILIPYLND